jgi:hypothetical protein
VPNEKLYVAFERALVNVVNDVGVMINDTVTDAYQQSVLPFVAGLGPRKATKLVRDIIKDTSVRPRAVSHLLSAKPALTPFPFAPERRAHQPQRAPDGRAARLGHLQERHRLAQDLARPGATRDHGRQHRGSA